MLRVSETRFMRIEGMRKVDLIIDEAKAITGASIEWDNGNTELVGKDEAARLGAILITINQPRQNPSKIEVPLLVPRDRRN